MIVRIRSFGISALAVAATALFFSHDQGKAIAQERKETLRPLFIMNADGSGLRHFVTAPDMLPHGSPDWSPIGDKVAFDAWGENEGTRDARIFVVDADGSAPVDLGFGAMPTWSSDGKQIAFHQYGSNRGIWVMNADGTARQQLTTSGISPRWSPDSGRIAYCDNGLTVLDTLEGEKRVILSQRVDHGFCWAPDGKRLCARARGTDGKHELLIINAEGQDDFRVRYRGEVNNFASWSPDGRKVIIHLDGPQQLFVLDPDSDGDPQPLQGQNPGRRNLGGCWAPDGKRILFIDAPRK